MTELLAAVDTEHDKISGWRTHVLLEAGYPNGLALEIGERHDVDLHRAVELVEAGCPPAQAAAILL